MTIRHFIWAVTAFLAFALAGTTVAQVQQSTKFTYQGQLNANGIPAAGQTLQFTFTLYDAATGGNVVGTAIPQSILVGSGGLFTTDLDFGQIFNGTQYWLDIQVGTTIGNEQELGARQPINTVPVAQYALNSPAGVFTEFYHTTPATLGGVTVPAGSAIPFSGIAISSGAAAPRAFYGSIDDPTIITGFFVQVSGAYEISFEVTTNDAGGDALAIEVGYPTSTIVPYAQTAQETKIQTGKFVVALNAGDMVSLVNVNTLTTLHLESFKTGATDANLVVRLLH